MVEELIKYQITGSEYNIKNKNTRNVVNYFLDVCTSCRN